MADEIYFADTSLSVVDEWISENGKSSFLKDDPPSSKGSKNPVSAPSGRLGLGGNQGKQLTKPDDILSARLKQNEKKRARDALDKQKEEDLGDLHGIIENDIEESRTQIASKKSAKKQQQENPESKKGKTDTTATAPSTTATATATAAAATATTAATSAEPVKLFAIGEPTTAADGADGAVNDAPVSERQKYPPGEKPQRFRKKTRSKQKNIRKDNRSAAEKPSYLSFGSKEYAGRQLTQETKSLLGIEKVSK